LDKIFVSHSAEDKAAYENLTLRLRRDGIDSWDVTALRAGTPLSDQLRVAIRECRACVFLATKQSVQSRWCMAELGAFWGRGKLVVVYLADIDLSPSELPPQFQADVWTESLDVVAKSIKEASDKPDRSRDRPQRIPGLRLFQHSGFYPIDIDGRSGRPVANKDTYARALDHFLHKDVYDRLAAMDLVYLRVDNLPHEPDIVPDSHTQRYDSLIKKYDLQMFVKHFQEEKERVFKNYLRIVNDFGQTLSNVHLEFLLHDVRNPIHSIIAAHNSLQFSKRRVGDPSTRFVINYVQNQGRDLIAAMEGGSKVAYLKYFTETRKVKATTTPIFDDLYGLVGILCLNIDIAAIQALDEAGRQTFFDAYILNTGVTPAFER
jgi:hypothetical protein